MTVEDKKSEPAREHKKVFISYSWSSQEWVIDLATELIENGIEVVLDYWDLREGDDKYEFMEKEVNDKSIDKVLIICDQQYKEKANNRAGGVGTEAQILTPELYDNNSPRKYIPILKELDDNQQPCVPTFLKTRLYVDFSNPQEHAESFERLVNVIYNQTITEKPKLGPVPNKILDHEANDYRLRRISTRINSSVESPHMLANLFQNEFIPEMFKLLKLCDISEEWQSTDENYQMVMEKLKDFDSVGEMFKDCVRLYLRSGEANIAYLADYFSDVNKFISDTVGLVNRRDAIKFILMEQFLIVTGELIRQREWKMLKYLVETKYKARGYKVHFESLHSSPMSIYDYNDQHEKYLSPVGELMAQRNDKNYNQLWCADVLLFYVGRLRFHREKEDIGTWVPVLQIRTNWPKLPDFSLLDNLEVPENMNVLLSLTDLSEEKLKTSKEYIDFTSFGQMAGVPAISKYDSDSMF